MSIGINHLEEQQGPAETCVKHRETLMENICPMSQNLYLAEVEIAYIHFSPQPSGPAILS